MSTRQSRPRDSWAQQDKIPELSCEACNERKVRCDKRNPCSTCQATGAVCVPIQRKRLPRGRHVKVNKENKELRERLARLESLITTDHLSSSSSSKSASIPISPANAINSPSGVPSASDPGAISYPPPVPSGVTSVAASNYPSIISNHQDPLLISPSVSSASLPRTKRQASPPPPPRYLANAFWNDLVDKVK